MLSSRLAAVSENPAGKIGDDQEVILFRDDARFLVVFGDGGIFIAQIHLDDLLHVLVEVGQLAVRSGRSASRCGC